ncbi:MAG: Ig-like domain-containing protein [Gemmatimonadaceae bacterium]
MSTSTKGKPVASIDRIIGLGFVLLLFTACSDSTTSPTPVATTLSLSSGGAQTGTVAAALATPVVVHVADQSGNSLSNALVTFAPNPTSGSVSSVDATTDVNGNAQVVWTLGTIAGTDTLVATIGTVSTTIVATATPGAAAAISIVAGNDQTAAAGSTLGTALSVKVTDAWGNAVANATVQWSDDAGGSFAASTTVTDANGIAQVAYTLGSNAGGVDDVTAAVVVNGTPMVSSAFTEDAM